LYTSNDRKSATFNKAGPFPLTKSDQLGNGIVHHRLFDYVRECDECSAYNERSECGGCAATWAPQKKRIELLSVTCQSVRLQVTQYGQVI